MLGKQLYYSLKLVKHGHNFMFPRLKLLKKLKHPMNAHRIIRHYAYITLVLKFLDIIVISLKPIFFFLIHSLVEYFLYLNLTTNFLLIGSSNHSSLYCKPKISIKVIDNKLFLQTEYAN